MRRIGVLLFLLLLATPSRESGAVGYLGIITGDVGDNACTIIHRNGLKDPCTARKIYAGDELSTNVPMDALKLVVHPAAEAVDLGDSRYAFRIAQVEDKDGLVRKMMSRFFEQEKHYAVNTVTRDWGDVCRKMTEYAKRTPPASVAILAGDTVRFPAPEFTKRFSVTDEAGALVHAAAVSGQPAFRPADIGLLPGREYVVTFEGPKGSRPMRLHVVDEAIEMRLAEAVRSLTAESPDALRLQAAAYYQMLSDLSPNEDYFFLSYQQLPDDLSSLPDRDTACNIMARYVDYLRTASPEMNQ